jgi:type IV pilus assembly protein PilE
MRKEREMESARKYGLVMSKRKRGFTLAEVLIVVAIVGILAAIAYPAYQDQLRKGRRAAAQNFMLQVANKQQQYLADARQYALSADATFLTTLSLSVASDVSNFYTLKAENNVGTVVATTPPSFKIIATPISTGPQAADGPLTLDNLGAKTRTPSSGVVGW